MEQSQEEESWSTQYRSRKQQNSGERLRVRELRNRFVCSVGLAEKRSCRRIVERRSNPYRSSPPCHEMPGDSDSNFLNNIESDNIFSPRPFNKRFSLRTRTTLRSNRSKRIRLRPLKSQCYTDPHSSMHSSGSDNEKNADDELLNLRRSTRQRKLQYDSFNTSWITDAQMVRGYPNLKCEFLSDQDSRHSQVICLIL